MDGTENLPNQIQETNDGMKKTNEAIRKQKMGEALKIMLDKNNRMTLSPIPNDMMTGGKVLAEAATAEEAVLFVKNYLLKVNEVTFEDTYPLADKGTDAGMILYMDFLKNKMADLLMVILVSGFLPEETLKQAIANEAEQGAYRDVLFQMMMMRAMFYNDMMLKAGMLDGDKKLDTVGKISKAIEYTEKLEFLAKLEFVDQIALKITGFDEKTNARLSKSMNKDIAQTAWKVIAQKGRNDFKAQSFSQNPNDNDAKSKQYQTQFEVLMKKVEDKAGSTKSGDTEGEN